MLLYVPSRLLLCFTYHKRTSYSSPKAITNHFSLRRLTDDYQPTFFFLALIVVCVEHSECYVRVVAGGICLDVVNQGNDIRGNETEVLELEKQTTFSTTRHTNGSLPGAGVTSERRMILGMYNGKGVCHVDIYLARGHPSYRVQRGKCDPLIDQVHQSDE